jgi:hypothetical protein
VIDAATITMSEVLRPARAARREGANGFTDHLWVAKRPLKSAFTRVLMHYGPHAHALSPNTRLFFLE